MRHLSFRLLKFLTNLIGDCPAFFKLYQTHLMLDLPADGQTPKTGHAFQLSANDRWIATVTGRVGYAFNWGTWGGAPGWGLGNGGAWLIYGKGGWGWGRVHKFTLTM